MAEILEIKHPADLKLYAFKGDDFKLLVKFQTDAGPIDLTGFDEIIWNIFNRFGRGPLHSFVLSAGDLQITGDNNELLKSTAMDDQLTGELGAQSTRFRHTIQFELDDLQATYVSSDLFINNVNSSTAGQSADTVTISEVTNTVSLSNDLDAAIIALGAQQATQQLHDDTAQIKQQADTNIEEAQTAALQEISNNKGAALSAIGGSKDSALTALGTTKTEALNAISDAANAGVAAVNAAANDGVDAVNTGKTDAVNVITGIKEDVENIQEAINTTQDEINTTAQQVDDNAIQVASDKQTISGWKDAIEILRQGTADDADRAEQAADIISRPQQGLLPADAQIGYQTSDDNFYAISQLELAVFIQDAQNWNLDPVTVEWNQDSGTSILTVV